MCQYSSKTWWVLELHKIWIRTKAWCLNFIFDFISIMYIHNNNNKGWHEEDAFWRGWHADWVLGGTRVLLKCWVGFMLDWLLPFWGYLFCVFVALTPNRGVWALRMVLPLICLDHLSACYFCVLFCFVVSFSFLFVVRVLLCLLLCIVCVCHCVFCCVWRSIIILIIT